jgi:CTP synthase (UTP-ammonia lyase)
LISHEFKVNDRYPGRNASSTGWSALGIYSREYYFYEEERKMDRPLKVGIIGDFDPNKLSHIATHEALSHAAKALAVGVELAWLATPSLEDESSLARLKSCDALWCAAASPYLSMNGALRAIRFAREEDWPFIGT